MKDPIILYVVFQIGFLPPIQQKTITLEFREQKVCEETMAQVLHLVEQSGGQLRVTRWHCIRKSKLQNLNKDRKPL